jgi:trehalose 6-phosphate synthase
MAKAFGIALKMSLDERRERWEAMMDKLRNVSAHTWFADFVTALGKLGTVELPAFAKARALDQAISL